MGSGKTLTIVGVGAPTIDREQSGRHFYVTGGGHLNVTGVTLANGKGSVSLEEDHVDGLCVRCLSA